MKKNQGIAAILVILLGVFVVLVLLGFFSTRRGDGAAASKTHSLE